VSITDRVLGLLCAPAYALQRSKAGPLRLHVLAALLGVVGAAYVAFRSWLYGFSLQRVLLVLLCLLWSALLLWVHRRRYLVFRPRPSAISATTPGLRPEQKLRLRGSGIFEVSGMRRYLVEVPAVFWTTRLAEHVVAAHVRAFNLLGVGVPSAERGWWYVFIEPQRVRRIEPGEICFGAECRLAVRVDYPAGKGSASLYLSCDDQAQLQMLLKELEARAAARHSQAA